MTLLQHDQLFHPSAKQIGLGLGTSLASDDSRARRLPVQNFERFGWLSCGVSIALIDSIGEIAWGTRRSWKTESAPVRRTGRWRLRRDAEEKHLHRIARVR